MKRIHVIGRKNHGKTTLVVDLVEEFTRRGLHVGTIKHTHHRHELDVPGKDSHQHRVAGAAVVGVLSRGLSAIFVPSAESQDVVDRYEALSPSFQGCDLVLVEGDSQAAAPKIEVWRAAAGDEAMAAQDPSILAVVTDDPLTVQAEILTRSNVAMVADWILKQEHWRASVEPGSR